ncbi:MAG: hypothetical protein C0462_03265 [Alcanivorax sp.]|nr:hypothetical protein [Alcanivorax sp.]
MIVTNRISLRKLVGFTWPQLLILLVFTVLACSAIRLVPQELLKALSFATGFLGTALAFLIGFRNNTAYGRWWEAHKVWSALKYETRNFGLLVQSLSQADATTQRQLLHRQAAFAWRLNRFLRRLPAGTEEASLLGKEEATQIETRQNPPLAILDLQNQTLRQLAADGRLDSYRLVQLTERLTRFNEALGSCERLKKTPFPMQYTWFMLYTLVVFLFLLPISLAGHLGYWSLPFSLIIGCAYIMLEYVGRYIETPFENQVNDVPMDYLSRTVENDLREMLGETGLPPAIKPQGLGYLY